MSSLLTSAGRSLIFRSAIHTVSVWRKGIRIILLLAAQSAFAQNIGANAMLSASLATRYPAGSILTMDAADLALAEALTERAQIEAQFALEEQACYPTFFASSCLDDAQERRRAALARMRPVEIEANTFNRRMRMLDRDKALAEKRAALATEAPQRAKDQQLRETETARKVSDSAQKMKALQDASNENAADAGKRVEEHAEKLRRLQAAETANAAKRAANVAAYAQKTRDAEVHQREVAANKVEKDRMRVRQSLDLPVVTKNGLPQPSGSSPELSK